MLGFDPSPYQHLWGCHSGKQTIPIQFQSIRTSSSLLFDTDSWAKINRQSLLWGWRSSCFKHKWISIYLDVPSSKGPKNINKNNLWELEFHSSSHEPQLDPPVGTFSGRKNRWRTYGTPILKTMKIDGTSMKFYGKSMEIQMENSACDLLGPLWSQEWTP